MRNKCVVILVVSKQADGQDKFDAITIQFFISLSLVNIFCWLEAMILFCLKHFFLFPLQNFRNPIQELAHLIHIYLTIFLSLTVVVIIGNFFFIKNEFEILI